MLFWKGATGKWLLEEMENLRKNVNRAGTTEEKKEKIGSFLRKIKGNADALKKEIGERAEEEIGRPWLDPKFDGQIGAFSRSEKLNVEKLRQDAAEYEGLLRDAGEADIEDILFFFDENLGKLKQREEYYLNQLLGFQRQTVAARLSSHRSDPPPSLRTFDNIRWKDIADAARQLGGWLVCTAGAHQCSIVFPKSRPIPLSKDVDSGRIAKQIHRQLRNFLPEHKIPNATAIEDAIKKGGFRKTG
ncbi:hypothetical protein HYU14_07170 [Candidatus Woesearchaeota archaeon]|nr:hypothetical protein [Candidatus Woesearchaeota archaeon]